MDKLKPEPLTQSRIDEIAAIASAGDLTGVTAEEVAFICTDNARLDAAWAHSHNQAMQNGAAANKAQADLREALDALEAVYEYETDDTTGPWPEAVAVLRKHGRAV